jgi:hypothetical protein
VQVSADRGDDPRWERDSHSIVYRNADRFMKARLAVGANIAVAQREALHVLSSTTGMSGLAILDAILAGERDPVRLPALCSRRVKNSRDTIAKESPTEYILGNAG